MPSLARPPTDVPAKEQVSFAVHHNGALIYASVGYVLLQQIADDLGPPLDMFRENWEKIIAAAAAKLDADQVDDEGFVRLGPGDIPPLTRPRD